MPRNLSTQAYFTRLASKHTPKYRFAGRSSQDWQRWREGLLPAVRASAGKMPEKVPLNPEMIGQWEEDGLIKQHVMIDVEDGLSAPLYLFRPAKSKGRLPLILASHGHGATGKDAVMGNRSSPERINEITVHNYDYGLQMAKAGFAVVAIDWRGFGVRNDQQKPNWLIYGAGRDMCNLNYLRASIMGMTVLGMDVHDGGCALDYACAQDFVDPDRIGVMGLSFGGTMTMWMSIMDERIKAADIICYSDRFADFGMRDVNFCGSQITPGLYALADLPDLQGLIAPRPLLVEIGTFDDCFMLDSAMSCYREVEKIYDAAGAREKLDLDLFGGGHKWGGNKSVEFFKRYL